MATLMIFVSLTVLITYTFSHTQACESGWFGPICQYKCRCARNCTLDGQCIGGACLKGWFGPACQYVDLAYNTRSTITDGDDNTCLAFSPPGNTIRVKLINQAVFTWLRIRVYKSDFLHRLTVQFKDDLSLACHNSKNASVDESTLDIHCDLDELVQSVTLSGEGVRYLCSVYISGGRNAALRQPTVQSSVYSENSTSTGWKVVNFSSNLSVDGNTNGDFYGQYSCSCTEPYGIIANWNVSFPQPQWIYRYVLYNRADGTSHRMIGFYLESFDQAGTMVFNYTDQNSISQQVYTVIPPIIVTSPISLTNILIKNSEKILQMCEVEVYGDSACDKGKYGRKCEYDCNCNGGETCFISTGGCPSGCKAGFYGESCYLPCRSGTYGLRCDNSCSEFCVKNMNDETSCDHVNGICRYGCLSGYQGPKCNTMCSPETYGLKCSKKCSDFCVKNVSDERSCGHVNGTCFNRCQSGYDGATCTSSCLSGRFGQDCSSTCSHFCVDTNRTDESPCDHITGVCLFGCTGGYDPSFCKQESIEDGDNAKMIIGAVVGSILSAVLVALVIIAVVVFRRRKKKLESQAEYFSDTENYGNTNNTSLSGAITMPPSHMKNANHTPTAMEGNRVKEGGNGTESNIYSVIYYKPIVDHSLTVVSLEELEEFMSLKDKDFFKDQFNAIQVNQTTKKDVGMSKENKHKNTYSIMYANKNSNVNCVPSLTKADEVYVNTSNLVNSKSKETFIVLQGTTNMEDFVKMLWEKQTEKVVMLSNLVEEGKPSKDNYWSEDGNLKVGDVSIELIDTQVFADYTIRRLKLKKEGHQGHDLNHFHFTSWSNKDIPFTPWSVVDFEQRVSAYPTSKPVVVHCSSDVDRTGMFIALRNVMRQAKETGHMDFFTTVQQLKLDKANMVQTVEQYIFLHRAALAAMLCIETTVTPKDIQSRIEELEVKMSSGQTKMEKEFKLICSICDVKEEEWTSEENPYTEYVNSLSSVNKLKNRFSSIIPREMYRAKLLCERPDLEDYINAVLVQSFNKQHQQILTQLPLPVTVKDFWCLVTHFKVKLIVAFDVDLESTDLTIANYLSPSDVVTSSLFKIKSEPTLSAMYWRQQKLVITMGTAMRKLANLTSTEQHVIHLTIRNTALDKGTQLAIIQHIRSLQQGFGESRILYMCRDGATYSGLACVLSLLLDRMDNDHCLNVPLVVGAIKTIRPEVIPTLISFSCPQDQYKFLYDVLCLYSEIMSY